MDLNNHKYSFKIYTHMYTIIHRLFIIKIFITMFQCNVCGSSCRNVNNLCFRHDPNSKEKARLRVNKYRQSDKGKQVVKEINIKQRVKLGAAPLDAPRIVPRADPDEAVHA